MRPLILITASQDKNASNGLFKISLYRNYADKMCIRDSSIYRVYISDYIALLACGKFVQQGRGEC